MACLWNHAFSITVMQVVIGHEVYDGFKLGLDLQGCLHVWTWISYEAWRLSVKNTGLWIWLLEYMNFVVGLLNTLNI